MEEGRTPHAPWNTAECRYELSQNIFGPFSLSLQVDNLIRRSLSEGIFDPHGFFWSTSASLLPQELHHAEFPSVLSLPQTDESTALGQDLLEGLHVQLSIILGSPRLVPCLSCTCPNAEHSLGEYDLDFGPFLRQALNFLAADNGLPEADKSSMLLYQLELIQCNFASQQRSEHNLRTDLQVNLLSLALNCQKTNSLFTSSEVKMARSLMFDSARRVIDLFTHIVDLQQVSWTLCFGAYCATTVLGLGLILPKSPCQSSDKARLGAVRKSFKDISYLPRENMDQFIGGVDKIIDTLMNVGRGLLGADIAAGKDQACSTVSSARSKALCDAKVATNDSPAPMKSQQVFEEPALDEAQGQEPSLHGDYNQSPIFYQEPLWYADDYQSSNFHQDPMWQSDYNQFCNLHQNIVGAMPPSNFVATATNIPITDVFMPTMLEDPGADIDFSLLDGMPDLSAPSNTF